MEISWKWINLCLGLLFFQLCNGFPINLEESVADKHTQLLTGLVAVLLTVCSIVLLAGCLCCQRRNGFKEFRDSPVVASAASNLDHGHVNPVTNGEFTIFTPLSPPHYNNNVFLANERIITRTSEDYVNGDFDVSSWFNESEKDFPRIKLKYIKELGKGWFGKVVEGAAKDLDNEKSWTPVVVRILEATASRKERVMFLNDAAIYRCGTHPNILFLIGRCLDTVPLLLLQEYCPQGDLKTYLKANQEKADKLLSTDHPLLWSCQLSSALKHLHDNNVTHPDLATRNCQLTANLTLKLGDYGLAVIKYPDDYYQGSPGVPVRWCSPESLNCTLTTIQPKKTTLESNIWSFGVTIWEILECGKQPYPDLSDDEVISQVLGSNVRLTRPSYPFLYTDYMYRLMQLCWTSSESRPTATQVDLILTDLLQVHKNTKNNVLSVSDFDKRWDSFKPNAAVNADTKSENTYSESEELEVKSMKPLSPSLNNLHGSLEDLLLHSSETRMNSWSENVETNDSPFAKNSYKDIHGLDHPLAQHNSSSDSSRHASPKQRESRNKSKIDFDLTSKYFDNSKYNFSDSVLYSQRTSSESETEDENWRNKVERGAYTEKVRLKSRSVADLMVLTHVDYSESESETPLPSLDYRINYKNVRYAPKNNLENVSLTYGSEGNLLSVHDTFQHDLKKMQEERRDSLLFVPDNRSQTSVLKLDSNKDNLFTADLASSDSNINRAHPGDTPSKRLMHELNSTADMKPANQIYNVFNVTIDKFKPMKVSNSKLNEIINFNDNISHGCNSEKPEPVEKQPCERSEETISNSAEELRLIDEQQIHTNRNDAQKNSITDTGDISDQSEDTYPAATSDVSIEVYPDTSVLSAVSEDEKLDRSSEAGVIKSETKTLKEENSENCNESDDHSQRLDEGNHRPDENIEIYPDAVVVHQVSIGEECAKSSESDLITSGTTNVASKEDISKMSKESDTHNRHLDESKYLCDHSVDGNIEIYPDEVVVSEVSDEQRSSNSELDNIKSGKTSEVSKGANLETLKESNNYNQLLDDSKSLPNHRIDKAIEIYPYKFVASVASDAGKCANSSESDLSGVLKADNSKMCQELGNYNQDLDENKSLDDHRRNGNIEMCPDKIIEVSDNNSELDVTKTGTTNEMLKENTSEICKDSDNHNHILDENKSLDDQRRNGNIEMCPDKIIVSEVSDDEKRDNNSESDVTKTRTTNEMLKENTSEICKDSDNHNQLLDENKSLENHRRNGNIEMCPDKIIVSEVSDDEKGDNNSGSDLIKSGTTSGVLKEDNLKMCQELDDPNQHLDENKSLDHRSEGNIGTCPDIVIISEVSDDEKCDSNYVPDVIKSGTSEILKRDNSEACEEFDNHNQHLDENKYLDDHRKDGNIEIYPDKVMDNKVYVDAKCGNSCELDATNGDNSEACEKLDNYNQTLEESKSLRIRRTDGNIEINPLTKISDHEKCGNSSESDVINSETIDVLKGGNPEIYKASNNQHLDKNKFLDDHRTDQNIETYPITVVLTEMSKDENHDDVSKSNLMNNGTARKISEDNSETCKELDNNQHRGEGKSSHIHRTDLADIRQGVDTKMSLSQVPALSEIIRNNELFYSIINSQNEESNKKLNSINKTDPKDTEKYDSYPPLINTSKPSLLESEKRAEENENCDEIPNCEVKETDESPDRVDVAFDLSSNQEKTMPNALTHMGGYSSTPFRTKIDRSLQSEDAYSSLNLFEAAKENAFNEDDSFSNLTTTLGNACDMNSKELNYSLETWDNFLGKTLDNQSDIQNENLFDSFSSEPHSLLFVQNVGEGIERNELEVDAMNKTFTVEDECDKTFVIDKDDRSDGSENETFILNKSNVSQTDDGVDNCSWESGDGWFLHPQSNEELSGVIEVTSANTDSYVGFGIDDEIMAAIRNELLTKLPQAQVATSEKVQDEEEWDSSERDEVFLKYNVYNPPLSPILEESYIEESLGVITPKQESENDDSEWSQPCLPETLLPDTESHSAHTCESPLKEPLHRHTPSQDSCCSNDTLFNLEELTCATADFEKEKEISLLKNTNETEENVKLDTIDLAICTSEKQIDKNTETNNNNDEKNLNDVILEPLVSQLNDQLDIRERKCDIIVYDQNNLENDAGQLIDFNITDHANFGNTHYISNFLTEERDHTSKTIIPIASYSKSIFLSEENPVAFTKCQVAPLPSPEDNPWKQLPASMLSYDKVKSQSNTLLLPTAESKHVHEFDDQPGQVERENKFDESEQTIIFEDNEPNYVNCDVKDIPVYENVDRTSDFYNEADYVNIENLENSKNSAEQVDEKEEHDYVNKLAQNKNDVIKNETDNVVENCIFGVLTDIRFNGPIDNQLLSTSFSESNDLNDEQDWDSGSDTRSSSSGEFIWKEGEHEESLKALRAAPQEMESTNPSAGITEASSDESDISSSTSGEEEETPEFIPSAWDKFATPTKSALRSPEKTLEKPEIKKNKGVWFKKQKYHCIYEYPREPESPVLQSEDLWKLQNPQIDYNSFTDWEFDADNYLPSQMEESDNTPSIYQPKHISSKNLYQLTNIPDLLPSNSEEDEFFVSDSAGLLDIIGNLSSQFFPGSTNWAVENATPDSGVEDITPASLTDTNEYSNNQIFDSNPVRTLKKLAAEAVNKNKQINIRNNEVLGGLRHTRNLLTLDLPLSPSAFTSAKTFTVEPTLESVVREKPTFTTFGKSRFSVQHVDTPSDEFKSKNVSFEALPYTPLTDRKRRNNSHEELHQNKDQSNEISEERHILKDALDTENCKGKFELVKGEASLLDSADEDSGIESSTLERKLSYDVLS